MTPLSARLARNVEGALGEELRVLCTALCCAHPEFIRALDRSSHDLHHAGISQNAP
jgi:hypothetical protein